VLIAVTTQRGSADVTVRLVAGTDEPPAEEAEEGEAHSDVEPKDGPSPIAPELKELAWGAGAFVVFAILMRLVLHPRVKKGMDARYASIRAGHEDADATRMAAQREVAEYQAQLAAVRAEVATRIDAARQQLETERQARLAEVNARIAERRAAAMAEVEAAREAARGQIEEAVAGIVARTTELATGRQPDAVVVSDAVSAAMGAGVGR
jgi:F-type H+-transporting ATPase subunit b